MPPWGKKKFFNSCCEYYSAKNNNNSESNKQCGILLHFSWTHWKQKSQLLDTSKIDKYIIHPNWTKTTHKTSKCSPNKMWFPTHQNLHSTAIADIVSQRGKFSMDKKDKATIWILDLSIASLHLHCFLITMFTFTLSKPSGSTRF